MMSKKIVCEILFVTLLMVSSGIVLAACGSNQAQTAGAQGTVVATHATGNAASPTSTVVAASSAAAKAAQAANSTHASATQAATSNGASPSTRSAAAATQVATGAQPVPSNVQNCGRVEVSPQHRVEDAGLTQQAGACFWQAYQQCRAAILVFQPLGVDAITVHTFSIEKQASGCVVTDSVKHSIVPRPATATNYSCAGVMNTNGALRITGCGAEGDVIVPLF